jgi:hypothetical protein
MVNIQIINPDRYWATLQRKLGLTMSEGLKDVARLACERAAKSTFPSGITNKTKEALEKSIYKDVNHAYLAVPNERLPSENGDYLFSHRNERGRVPSTTRQKAISFSDYTNIKQNLVKNAGMAKAGYLDAAKQLKDTVRVPVWLRKRQVLATVSISDTTIVVINHVKYASNLITDKQLQNAMENAFKGLLKRAEKMRL